MSDCDRRIMVKCGLPAEHAGGHKPEALLLAEGASAVLSDLQREYQQKSDALALFVREIHGYTFQAPTDDIEVMRAQRAALGEWLTQWLESDTARLQAIQKARGQG